MTLSIREASIIDSNYGKLNVDFTKYFSKRIMAIFRHFLVILILLSNSIGLGEEITERRSYSVELRAWALYEEASLTYMDRWIIPLSVEFPFDNGFAVFSDVGYERIDISSAHMNAAFSNGKDPTLVTHGSAVNIAPGARYYLSPKKESWYGEADLNLKTENDSWEYSGYKISESTTSLIPTVGVGYVFVPRPTIQLRFGGGLLYMANFHQKIGAQGSTDSEQTGVANVEHDTRSGLRSYLKFNIGVLFN